MAVGTAATPKVCMEVAARGQWSSKSCPGRIDGLVMLLDTTLMLEKRYMCAKGFFVIGGIWAQRLKIADAV